MSQIKRVALVLGIMFLQHRPVFGESLPHYPVDLSVLKSDLIVEGRITGEKIVTIDKVHFGDVQVGNSMPVDRLKGLATVAHEKWDFPRVDSDEGISTDGETVVLFLIRQDGKAAYEPFGWGSGVKWVLMKNVYGYRQVFNPGPYFLLPDRDTPSLDSLRVSIRKGLSKRQEFQAALLEADPTTKAQKLSQFIQPTEPSHYFREGVEKLQSLGHAGALVFRRELDREQEQRRRVELIYALGRTKDKDSLSFLVSVMSAAKQAVLNTDSLFDDSKASQEERNAVSDWLSSIYAISEIGNASEYLSEFREAAVWGAKHRSHLLMEYGVRGMGKAPSATNLPTFREIFDVLPKEEKGFGRHAAHIPLRVLIEHKNRDAVPILASQLDHPVNDIRGNAHEGLIGIVGSDLGTNIEPWLQWYSATEK